MYAYMLWADTTAGIMKMRNGANSAWISLWELDGTFIATDISLSAGTAGAPSLYFTGDTNTGIYSPGADQVAITTGGTQRLAADTTAVTSTLPVVHPLGAVGTPSITFTGDTNTGIYSPGADQVAISTNGTQRLTVDTAATTSTLPVVHPLGAVGTPSITFTGDLNTGIYSPAADTIAFVEGGAEAMRIDSSGRVGIGITGPGELLDVFGGNIRSTNGFVRTSGSSANAVTTRGFRQTIDGTELLAIYHDNNGAVFNVNTSERARIDSSGRLLVGTSSSLSTKYNASSFQPDFQVAASFGASGFYRYSNNADGPSLVLSKSRSGTLGTQTVVSDGDTVGYLGFAGSDGTAFQTAASISAQVDGTPGANDMPGRLVFSTTADGTASPTERMRITAAGALSYSPCSGADVVGTEACGFIGDGIYAPVYKVKSALTTTKNCAIFVNGNGQVGSIQMSASATSYNTSSDYRLKENVLPITSAANRVQQLKPRRFNFIADPEHTVDGFIAHEAQAIVPECVTGDKDAVDADGNPIYQGIDQSKLVPLLTAALQEAITEIASLKDRVAALEAS